MRKPLVTWIAALACTIAVTGAQAGGGFEDADLMRDLFRSIKGEQVGLHGQGGNDQISVSTRGDQAEWTVCQVGVDFVRFCHHERDEAAAYPMANLVLRTKGPDDD